MPGLVIGPGLAAWIVDHQATPLGSEFGTGAPWTVSAVEIEIGNSAGQKIRTVLGYDAALNAILEPGPGVVLDAAQVWTPPSPQSVGALEAAIEQANQQGYDATCGARTVVMAAVEDGLLAIDQGADKALVDELWNLVNPGVSEFDQGMTLWDQFTCILHVGGKYGKTTTICPLRMTAIADPATASAAPESANFPGETKGIRHMTAGVNLSTLLGINSNHFVLKALSDTDAAADERWEILDSCHNVDGDPDHFSIDRIVTAADGLFEDVASANGQFGWAWTWD